jgi:hypothetical protein
MVESAPNSEEILEPMEQGEVVNDKPINALVVFGGGIHSDENFERMAMGKSLIGHPEKGNRVPLLARLRVLGAVELYLQGKVEDVILTGGPVAKDKGIEASEAELMREYFLRTLKKRWRTELKQQGLGENEAEGELVKRLLEVDEHILLEDKATNTIENFAHTISFLEENKTKYQHIGFISNEFHMDRILQLGRKFQVEGERLPSEPLVSERDPRLRKITQMFLDPEINGLYREEVIDKISDPEQKRIAQARFSNTSGMVAGERRWSRGLEEMPAYWLPNVAVMEPQNLRAVLAAEQQTIDYLGQKGINPDELSDEDLQSSLRSIQREIPPVEWEREEE